MISYIEGDELNRFTDYVNGVVEDDRRSLNGFTTIDITRQIIFNSTILIRAYFSLFADIAQMWVEISAMHLVMGASLVDGLAGEVQNATSGNTGVLNKRISDLKKWTGDATDSIKKIAKEVSVFLEYILNLSLTHSYRSSKNLWMEWSRGRRMLRRM